MKDTKQIKFWKGQFGKDYTDRCQYSDKEWDNHYLRQHGKTKIEMNNDFIGNLSKDIKILEVGCNVGNQLRGLQRQGFKNLYGIELQWYAVEESKKMTTGINIIQGSGFDIPFKDNYFDLVFTNGVLIHIRPEDLSDVMREIYRVVSKYIWGWEYFAEDVTEINYRGNEGFLWKADYAKIYLETLSNLKEIKKQVIPYINEEEKGNVNCMFLLEKM